MNSNINSSGLYDNLITTNATHRSRPRARRRRGHGSVRFARRQGCFQRLSAHTVAGSTVAGPQQLLSTGFARTRPPRPLRRPAQPSPCNPSRTSWEGIVPARQGGAGPTAAEPEPGDLDVTVRRACSHGCGALRPAGPGAALLRDQ